MVRVTASLLIPQSTSRPHSNGCVNHDHNNSNNNNNNNDDDDDDDDDDSIDDNIIINNNTKCVYAKVCTYAYVRSVIVISS